MQQLAQPDYELSRRRLPFSRDLPAATRALTEILLKNSGRHQKFAKYTLS
jgi:hypothetical protein